MGLQLKKMEGFNYGGRSHDFYYVVDKKTKEPVHPICGFALSGIITGKHKTAQSSKSIVQPLKKYFEEFVAWNNLDWRYVSEEKILLYLYEYRYKRKKLCGKSIALEQSAIQSFYNWAYKYGFIDCPRELDIGFYLDGFRHHVEYDDPHASILNQYVSRDEFENILAHIPSESSYLQHRNELVLTLGYECGIRTSELVGVHNFNVNKLLKCIEKAELNNETTFLFAVFGKGNGKVRNIVITSNLFFKLKRFIRDGKLRGMFSRNLPLFLSEKGVPIRSKSLGSTIFKLAKYRCRSLSGEDWDKKVFHSLRHSYATNLATWCAVNGYDWRSHVPSRMGHSHWKTSQIYVEAEALMNNRIEIINELKPVAFFKDKGNGLH